MKLRDEILKNGERIMDFTLRGYRNTSKGKFEIFNNGPIIEYDGNIIGTVYDILCQIGRHNPTRKQIKSYLLTRGLLDQEGVYVVDNGTRSSVVCTSNIANSVAKVILDGYNATKNSDSFSKRIAKATKLIFTPRMTRNNYYAGAKISGLLDNLKPDKCLSDTKQFYRNYPSYKKGLLEGCNYNTYMIEECLDHQIKPEFIPDKQLKFWRDKSYQYQGVMKAQEFVNRKGELLSHEIK